MAELRSGRTLQIQKAILRSYSCPFGASLCIVMLTGYSRGRRQQQECTTFEHTFKKERKKKYNASPFLHVCDASAFVVLAGAADVDPDVVSLKHGGTVSCCRSSKVLASIGASSIHFLVLILPLFFLCCGLSGL